MVLSTREMSSFLMYRMLSPETNNTIDNYFPNRIPIRDSMDLEQHLASRVQSLNYKKTALALSGGIDSAILARFMPAGSIAYTFKCVVPGMEVTDETPKAAEYARECKLDHRIIEVYWEDFEKYAPVLMKHKKAPIHSIEVQIYKAALQAKEDGVSNLIFGEAADAVYGGLSNLLSQEWKVGDFIQRYSFCLPYLVLKKPELPIEIIKNWTESGFVDPHSFISNVFIQESVASYINAAETAGINLVLPYPETFLATSIDYNRIRSGENKYLVREVFNRLFKGWEVPTKTPMPRPMNEWLRNWGGPKRSEFWENCADGLTGDQKWQLWSLETFMNMTEA